MQLVCETQQLKCVHQKSHTKKVAKSELDDNYGFGSLSDHFNNTDSFDSLLSSKILLSGQLNMNDPHVMILNDVQNVIVNLYHIC